MVALGQVTVVVYPSDTTVCYRNSVAFTTIVTGTVADTVKYRWQKSLVDISGATDSIYGITHVLASDTGTYRCIISVDHVDVDTSSVVTLRMRPRMYIDTLYRYNPIGCPTIQGTTTPLCKGQFKTLVSGGTQFKNYPPYIYEWHGGHSQDTIVFGLCPGSKKLTVTDSLGCSLDSVYFVDVFKLPKVDFSFSPGDTIYLTNPTVSVSFPDSMKKHLTNWTWNFGDSVKLQNINPASHTYSDTTTPGQIKVLLSFTDFNGCDTTITHNLTVKVAELEIPNLFTPNGDGVNDKFAVRLKDDKMKDFREAYLSNEFLVFDRWGRKVFNRTDYKSEDWDGERLSDGTYFYILRCMGQYGNEVFRGSVTILRGQ